MTKKKNTFLALACLACLFMGVPNSFAQNSTIRYANVASGEGKAQDSLTSKEVESYQWVAKGNALHDNGMYAEAIACYRKADSLTPNSALVFYEMAYSFALMQNVDSSLFYGKKSVAVEPMESAFSLLGDIYDHQDKLDSALKYYDAGLVVNPKSYNLLYNKAVALYVHKQAAKAYDVILRSLECTHRHEGSYFLASQIAFDMGKWRSFFANGLYSNLIGTTEARMKRFAQCFMYLFTLDESETSSFLNPDAVWVRTVGFRYLDTTAKRKDAVKNGYDDVVAKGVFAIREIAKMKDEYVLKPFFAKVVKLGYEEELSRIAFRELDSIAFESWKMMNGKRVDSFYKDVVVPFWEDEKKPRKPEFMQRK